MDVTGIKGPQTPGQGRLAHWALNQLLIASTILDNPGGGLLFATQTLGQVRAALVDSGEERFREALLLLAGAEDAALRREFETSLDLVRRTAVMLGELDQTEVSPGSGLA